MKISSRLLPLVYLCLIVPYISILIGVVNRDLSWSEDFTALYTGWVLSQSEDKPQLYNLDIQKRYQANILARDGHESRKLADGLLPYLNPPHVTHLFSPLTLLSRKTAFVVFLALGICLLIVLWRLLSLVTPEWTTNERQTGFAAMLAFPLTVLVLGVGALSLFVAVCIFGAYVGVKKESEGFTAVCLALATVKPQMAIFPIVGFLVFCGWRVALIFTFAMLGLILTAMTTFGVNPFLDYPRLLETISQAQGQMSLLTTTTSTFRGILLSIFGYGASVIITILNLVVMVSLLVIVKILFQSKDNLELKTALAITVGLFFGPHVNPVDDLLVILPAVLLYTHYRKQWFGKYLAAALLVFPFVMFIDWRVFSFRPFSPTLHVLMIGMLTLSVITIVWSKQMAEENNQTIKKLKLIGAVLLLLLPIGAQLYATTYDAPPKLNFEEGRKVADF